MNPETKIQRKSMMALSQAGHTVFRNETGNFWTGQVIHKDNNTVTLMNAAMIPCGLAVGSSDIIVIQSVLITPEMVGQVFGRFGGCEIKTPTGRMSPKQINFMDHVNGKGGIAGVARTPEEAVLLFA